MSDSSVQLPRPTRRRPSQWLRRRDLPRRLVRSTPALGDISTRRGIVWFNWMNTVEVSGLRISAAVVKQGPPGAGTAEIRIYGLTQDLMNQLSTLGKPLPMARLNTVILKAGDATNGLSAVYQGNLNNAWQNLDNLPEPFFEVIAAVGTFDALKPVPPLSFPGQADTATVMAGIATTMGRAFENNGVQVPLAKGVYLPGTALEQAQSLARMANIELFDDGMTLAIWPKSGSRGGTIPLISPQSGLVGYPRYTDQGMQFSCIFNPSILFGGQIQMQSSITPANGTWYVNGLTYDLACYTPGGPWFCVVSLRSASGEPVGVMSGQQGRCAEWFRVRWSGVVSNSWV